MDDEAAHAIVALYDTHAAAWDDGRGRTLFERPWLERFGALVPSGGHVLDIGCGAGEPIAGYLQDAGFAITGVDSSPAMIALCAARFSRQHWVVGDMRTLALGQCYDGLIAWNSFFHLRHDDQRTMFAIFGQHARPGAPLLFTSGPEFGVAMGVFQGAPLFHASLDPSEYRTLLRSNGFEVVQFEPNDPNCAGHSVWLARKH
jgi:SAM-dependent methyltransferase